MRQNILTIKHAVQKLLAFSLLLLTFMGCKKADQFYDTLKALPQIDNTAAYAYRTTYVTGDTMTITGKLYPHHNLQVSIGNIEANIIKIDSVGYKPDHIIVDYMDRISILITAEMEGKSRQVKITSGGNMITGAAIDVYSVGGTGSFSKPLKSQLLGTLSNTYKFLYCLNGKGDVYYYAPNTKDLRHIKKDGTQEVLYDLSGVPIQTFLAGGITPDAKLVYFSGRTTAGNYGFWKLDLTTNTLISLNQSTAVASPYEGDINDVKMIVTGVYPTANGNCYLSIGLGNGNTTNFLPDAIARYTGGDNQVKYIYKGIQFGDPIPGMPGTKIGYEQNIIQMRLMPAENLLYGIEKNPAIGSTTIEVFDLLSKIRISRVTTLNTSINQTLQYNVIAPFTALQTNLSASVADQTFGYLPLPGKRLQTLLFQSYKDAAKYGFPKWTVFDFTDERTYAYAPGRFMQGDNGQYALRETDELLNYDEQGHLYMTSNGKSYLLKTQEGN